MISAKHRSSISPLLLILLLLLVLVVTTLLVDASLTSVYMHYYCRQQCEQGFKICAMSASESSSIFLPCVLLCLFYFHSAVSYCLEWLVSTIVLITDLDCGVLISEWSAKKRHRAWSGLRGIYTAGHVVCACFITLFHGYVLLNVRRTYDG